MKRSKKHNAIQAKQENQHQRNLFYQKIHQMMALIGDAKAFDLLDKKMLESLYQCRIHPHKIIARNNQQLKNKKQILNTLNTTLSEQLHKSFIEIDEQKIRVSLYDFIVYVQTIYIFWSGIEDKRQDNAVRFREYFPLFHNNFMDTWEQAMKSADQKLEIVSWLYSDIDKQTIRFSKQWNEGDTTTGKKQFYNNFYFEEKDPETETLEIDGHKRILFRVCATIAGGFIPLTITPEKLGMKGLLQNYPLKIFIQMHALERIETRLGKIFRMFHYQYIITAILASEPIPADEKNSFLIPLTNGKARLGYLKADVIGDKLVIRTFLFLTNNGTPEGKKLNQLFGLQKADKKYLGIDKLSTFILSDIRKDEKLKALFCEAGCGELFSLGKSFLIDPPDKELAAAAFISHYLGI